MKLAESASPIEARHPAYVIKNIQASSYFAASCAGGLQLSSTGWPERFWCWMKRFTDTAKWSKAWYQDLPPHLKCLWQFICDNADAAGVWEPNFRLASFQIGKTVSEADLVHFGDRLGRIESGKIVLVSFIEFQYGKLSQDCKAHVPVFRLLEKHRLPDSLLIPYPKAINSHKEEDKEKEEETEKDRGSAEGETFARFWDAYPRKVAKGNAEVAWKKNGCAQILPQILTSVRACKVSADWTKEGGQFIPHPATWLNRKGWEDELLPRGGGAERVRTYEHSTFEECP